MGAYGLACVVCCFFFREGGTSSQAPRVALATWVSRLVHAAVIGEPRSPAAEATTVCHTTQLYWLCTYMADLDTEVLVSKDRDYSRMCCTNVWRRPQNKWQTVRRVPHSATGTRQPFPRQLGVCRVPYGGHLVNRYRPTPYVLKYKMF
jgi:hypothetical protein